MPTVEVNYWAVLACGVWSMVQGMVWYNPAVFGKLWMKLSGIHQSDMKDAKKGMGGRYALAFLGSLVMAYVLSHVVDFAKATTLMDGIQAGFWMWLGFVGTVSLSGFLWEKKPFSLWVLNNAYSLVQLVVMGIILTLWV